MMVDQNEVEITGRNITTAWIWNEMKLANENNYLINNNDI